jgi:predicted transcriptional regulator
MGDIRDLILEPLMKRGKATSEELAKDIGATESLVLTGLVDLQKTGFVQRIGQFWEPADEYKRKNKF